MKCFRSVSMILAGVAISLLSPGLQAAENLEVEAWVGGGYWEGNTTLEIGGAWSDTLGNSGVDNNPVSRLRWAVDVYMVSVGGSALIGDTVELRSSYGWNVEEETAEVEDSDWLFSDAPSVKTVYSESDSDLDSRWFDAALRYWLPRIEDRLGSWRIGIGGGYMTQELDWDADDLYQVYPFSYDIPPDAVEGPVGTYETTVEMPYVEICCQIRFERFRLEGSYGYAPEVSIEDVDDHILREKRSTSDIDGDGWKLEAKGSYEFDSGWFIAAQATALHYDGRGMEEQIFYGGENEGLGYTVENQIRSSQWASQLAVGYRL